MSASKMIQPDDSVPDELLAAAGSTGLASLRGIAAGALRGVTSEEYVARQRGDNIELLAECLVSLRSAVAALTELRKARAEVDAQAALVRSEMRERSERGHLWTNGKCAAWPSYEAAVKAQSEVRRRHEASEPEGAEHNLTADAVGSPERDHG